MSYLVVIFIVCALLWIYRWSTVNFAYFSNQGIHGPKPLPLVGTWRPFCKSKMYQVELDRYTEFGRIYGTFDGRRPNLVVSEPWLMRQILVTQFDSFVNRRQMLSRNPYLNQNLSALQDDDWKLVRKVITPAFSSAKIKLMHPIMAQCAQTLTDHLTSTVSNGGDKINIKSAVNAFVLDVIASCGFGTKIDAFRTDNPFVTTATKTFSAAGAGNPIFAMFFLYPGLARYLPASMFHGLNFFAKLSQNIVEERRLSRSTGPPQKPRDFLDLLLEAAESEVEGQTNPLTDNVTLVAQVTLFLLAGFDTTALTISLTLHFLAVNEPLQVKVRDEMRLKRRNYNSVCPDLLSVLQYMEQCILETWRLCPPVTRVERVCKNRMDFTPVSIHSETVVTIPIMAIHRDPANYPDPLTYDPDRFCPESKQVRDPMTYVPFGAGPRHCIGMRFALAEIKLCLYYLLDHFKFVKTPETKDPPVFGRGSTFGLMQNHSIILGLQPINR